MLVVMSLTRLEEGSVTTTSLWIPAALCGMALLAAGQRAAVDRFSPVPFFAFRHGCIAAGLFLLWRHLGSEANLVAASLIGLGVGTDWSPLPSFFRGLLSSRNRWTGIRLWSLAFPAGVFAAVATSSFCGEAAAAGAVFSLVCAPVWLLTGAGSACNPETESATEPPAESSTKTTNAADRSITDTNRSTDDETSVQPDCDADECCGGPRDFQPTSFSLGVVISVVGFSAVWTCTFDVLRLALQHASFAPAVAAAAGLMGGTWLLFSAAPRVGYIVTIFPFLLLAGAATIACGLVSPTSPVFVPACLLCGFFAGGVSCGSSAMIGELVPDCRDNAVRSRVITVSLFATAALSLVVAMMRSMLQAAELVVMLNSLIFVVGIVAVRSIPGPIISSLGSNDPSDAETEAEREDIAASISN
jgi:hypothetical protein